MSTRAPSRLDAYLAWQSDVGTPEVVFPEPWTKPARAASPVSAKTPNDAMEIEAAPSHRTTSIASPSPASEDFFRDIQKRLAEPARKVVAPKAVPVAVSPAPNPAASVPAFASLEEYWSWLAEEYPRRFPGVSSTLARAAGNAGAKLAVVEMFPANDAIFGGEAGALLDKMMQAIGLSRDALYLTSVMKTAPAGKSWTRKDIALALPAFLAELRLAGCGAVLLLGEACAQSVLRTGKSLSALEAIDRIDEVSASYAAIWHPADLLRDASLKAPAWTRLKNLKTFLDRTEGPST